MSGPAIHHIVANKAIADFAPNLNPDFSREIMSGKFNPYLNLGSQGPDWLFFLTKDWNPTLNTLVKAYLEIDHFIEKLKADILALIPPELIKAVEDLKQAIDDVTKRSSALTVIKDTLTRAKNILALVQVDLMKFVEKYVTDSFNIFNFVTTAYHDVKELKDWWWFDTLHYRKTGDFAKALLNNSEPNSGARAFAMGYLTHYACDTVGHPFVNTMVGGPYRTHSQRHKFVENHHDVWAWNEYMNEEFIKSNLGENQYELDGDEDFLPEEVKELILASLRELYFKDGAWLYGKEVTGDDLDNAYQLWLNYFKRCTNVTELPEPVPYSYSAEAEAVFNRFKDNVSDIGDAITNPGSGGWSLLSIFEAIAIAIISPFLLAAAAIDFILGEIESLAAAPINYLLSYIYENLYSAFKQLHYGLALNGLAYPFADQLNTDISKHTTDSSIDDKNGNNASDLIEHYPMKKFSIVGMENTSHLIYPFPSNGNVQEKSITAAAPPSYFDKSPNHYIDGNLRFSKNYFDYVSDFKPRVESEEERQSDFENFQIQAKELSLGNAVDFSNILLQDFFQNGENAKFPNFNLDGDRGYAFRGWRLVNDKNMLEVPTSAASFHELIDNADIGSWPSSVRTEDKDVPNQLTDIIQSNSNVL